MGPPSSSSSVCFASPPSPLNPSHGLRGYVNRLRDLPLNSSAASMYIFNSSFLLASSFFLEFNSASCFEIPSVMFLSSWLSIRPINITKASNGSLYNITQREREIIFSNCYALSI